MQNKGLRILSVIVICYMLAALLWWGILLYRKNNESFLLKKEILELKYNDQQNTIPVDVYSLPEYAELKSSYERQMYMILGESVVFGITLIMGIFFINRAYNRELNAAEKQKNFLLSITHELKSPLASINLILDTFIKRDLPQQKIKELSRDGILESSRLEELFNKILTATRLNTAYTFNFKPSNLSEVLKNITERFEHLHPEINIEKNIDEKVIVRIDEEAMVSVIKNLLENAEKYSEKPKRIHIELVSIREGHELRIGNNGQGIEKKERQRIFEQFYRTGSEETRKSKGTGLGLYIVKQIIDAHGFKIKVDDSDLGGALFTIAL